MSRIFLSHSSANNAAALALGQWLETQGWSDYFLDIDANRGISAGERWLAAFTSAVDRCEAVIFVLSPAWNNSKFCFSEFLKAKELGKRIFGVIVEPIDLSELPVLMTSEWQVCDLTDNRDLVSFTVEQAPLVARTVVRFPSAGLQALGRGLQKAGLDASTFVWPPESDPGRSPYPGLRALDEADAAVFFGRDAAIVRAIDELRLMRERAVGQQLFVILGASGAGKSSFLRAGLLPRLKRDAEHFVVLPPLRPERAAISGSQGLLASLRASLAATGQPMSPAQVRAALTEAGLASLLRRIESPPAAADKASKSGGRTVIVPIDQGEELFATDGHAEADQLLHLIETLCAQLTIATPGVGRLRVLFAITIRSDSLPLLQQHGSLQALSPVLISLPAMPATEFKAVIEGPARRHTETVKPLLISPELTEKLVAGPHGADALPLLALTLEWLYREFTTAQGTHIGREQYLQIGGVRGVIDMAVKRAFEQPGNEPAIPALVKDQESLLLKVFPFIATADPDSGEWKRRVTPRQAIQQEPQADAMVTRLIGQRLLLSDARSIADDAEPVEVIEVAHEALLRNWEPLERWLLEFSAALAAVEAIRRSANDWQRGECDATLLVHTAHRLEAAEALYADDRLHGRFESVDAQYLAACHERDRRAHESDLRADEEREEHQRQIAQQQAARAQWQKLATWGLSATTAIVLGLVVWVVLQTQSVSRQTSLVLAGAAETAADEKRFDQSVRLATLAAKASWLRPADPTARPALARAADGKAWHILLAHDGTVRSATFSPDGKRVVTASVDNTARVWDAETGRAMGEPMKHDKWINSASFSPDGKRIVTASADYTARVWDTESGKAVSEPLKHHFGVNSASFSPDGMRVVTASSDTTARVWDAKTGKAVGEPFKHSGGVASANFNPDGQRVVTASSDGTSRIWDIGTGKAVGEPMKPDGEVISASFSPDGKRVLTVSHNWTVRVWEAATGEAVGTAIKHDGPVTSASFSPNGRRVVTASNDTTARVWDAETSRGVGEPFKHDDEVWFASFSPDGKRIVTASKDSTARVWDAESGKVVGGPFKHDGSVLSASFSPDGARVVTASEDKTARVWEAKAGKSVGEPFKHFGNVSSASFSPDGKRVATASNDGTARVWDADTGEAVGEPMKHGAGVASANFNPDGKRVVTASYDGTARVWDARTGEGLGKPMRHDHEVWSASFSPDGQRVLASSYDKTARIWDAKTGEAMGEPMKHEGPVISASFSPDGKRIVTASADGTARVWNAETGKPVGEPMKHDRIVSAASFSPNGKRVVTASADLTARIWDTESGRAVREPMKHDGPVASARFSPDGKRVVTSSADQANALAQQYSHSRVWDTETGRVVGEPMKHDERINSANFSPDGKRIVTASADETARIWDAETGKAMGEPMKHFGRVYSARFSPDGKRVLTASADKTARVWLNPWSAIASAEALIAASCARVNLGRRLITAEDIALAKVIAGDRKGEDVCTGKVVTPAS